MDRLATAPSATILSTLNLPEPLKNPI